MLVLLTLWQAAPIFAQDPVVEDPVIIEGEQLINFGNTWDFIDDATHMPDDWFVLATEAVLALPPPEPPPEIDPEDEDDDSDEPPPPEPSPLGGDWMRGRAPFLGRSVLVHETAEAERRRRNRRRRRRSSPFQGTLLVYDSEQYLLEGETLETVAAAEIEPGPSSYVFTHEFELERAEEVVSLFVEARFSAGFVAYLNGRELVRHNVDASSGLANPADIVWQPDWVNQTIGNVWQRAHLGLDPQDLREGRNVLTVSVHRRETGGRRSMYFDLQMRAFREHGFIKTPYLQNVQPDAMTVMWETSAPSIGYVEFGSGEWLERVATSPELAGTLHEVVLTDLTPDTLYFYRVHSLPINGELPSLESEIHSFRTSALPGTPFNFMLYGDNRSNIDVHTRIVELMMDTAASNDVRFVLNTGDLTAHASWWDEWQREFFEPALPMMATLPMYTVIGNHEGNHETYYEYLDNPNNGAWYTFSYGDVDFFGINTSARFAPESAQYVWLDEALQASDAAWQVAFFHHPPYSCVPSRKPGNEDVIEYLAPLFAERGVDLVLLGHDHLYGRSRAHDGVYYIISGGGGASTYPADADRHMDLCIEVHHFCLLRASADVLELEAITIDGELLDTFRLTQ